MWRGGGRLNISVFRLLCLAVPYWFNRSSVSTPRSSNRTCRFPASSSRTRPHAFACNAICSFRTDFGVDRFPNLRSLTTCCVRLELRLLSSTGITRLPRYYEPLRHPGAPGLSLAGLRLIIPDHASGLPVLRALSSVYMLPPLPRCSRRAPIVAQTCPSISAFPERVVGSACTASFSRPAQRSLTLRPAHSRGHQCVTR